MDVEKYREATRILRRYLELATTLGNIENPTAWALYQTWKHYDGSEYCANCGRMYDQFKTDEAEV